VWTENRDSRFDERDQHATLRRDRRQTLNRAKENRMVRDNELNLSLNCFIGYFRRQRKTSHDPFGVSGPVSQKQADVVPFRGQVSWGEMIQILDNCAYRNHDLFTTNP
jgi:hypothetical protein